MNRHFKADLGLVLITLIWGSTFVVVKQALDTVAPLVFVASRFWMAGLVLGGIFWIRRADRRGCGIWEGVIAGSCLTLGFVTQTIALQTTEAGKTAFITGLSVVLVPGFSALLLRKPPSAAAIVGAVAATVGLGLMTLKAGLAVQPGDLWALACVLGFALHITVTAHFSSRQPVLWFTLVQMCTVAILTTGAALYWERQPLVPAPGAWPAILYMGWIATALVFGVQSWGQRYTTPTHAALIFSLEPVFAALFAAQFAGEQLELRTWVGGGLILLGMLASELGGMLPRWEGIRSWVLSK